MSDIASIQQWWLKLMAVPTGSEQAEDAAQYWQRQHDYLTRGTHWLPTIGVPVHAERVFWSKCVPAALMKKQGCLLILDKPQLVLALHVLQGWAAQHAIDNTSKTEQFTCALFGKVADLHQQLMQEEHWSAKALCDNHGLHLVAAYSTNKPLKDRYSAYTICAVFGHIFVLSACTLANARSVQTMHAAACRSQTSTVHHIKATSIDVKDTVLKACWLVQEVTRSRGICAMQVNLAARPE